MVNNIKIPESRYAEAALLGSMMVDSTCVAEVVDIVKVEMFVDLEHRTIYQTMTDLYNANSGTFDGMLVRQALEDSGQLKKIGGVEYLARVIESVPSAANVKYYADIVKRKHIERSMIADVDKVQRQYIPLSLFEFFRGHLDIEP